MPGFPRLKQSSARVPQAEQREYFESLHGERLSDPWNWLKDTDYPDVKDQAILDYLNAENEYFDAFMAPHQALVERLFEEFKGRTDEHEESVPFIQNGYEYRWYFRADAEYKTYVRRNLAGGPEEVLLDVPALAAEFDYFVLGDWVVSPDNSLLAYSFDTNGDERYSVNVIDLRTQQMLPDVLENVHGELEFSADGDALVYALLDEQRWHANRIMAHTLGTEQATDRILYEELDEGFFIGFQLCTSREFFIIFSSQGEVQESYALRADLAQPLQKIAGRELGCQQKIDHAYGYFYLLENGRHKNFLLRRVIDQQPESAHWQTLQEGSDQRYLLAIQCFATHLVLKLRESGIDQIEILAYPSGDTDLPHMQPAHRIPFDEAVYTVSLGLNVEFTQRHLRLNYESMVSPATVYDYQLDAQELVTRKVQKIPSGYDPSQYQSERIFIRARDGADIPVSLVYRKGFRRDGSQPLWLYGYGAYAATVTPYFSALRLSALDRGFCFAIAHVRGGAMMGYQWYLDGKLDKRTNTFNDFVDVARGLIDKGYVSAGNISISGRSAGGELMGAAVIQAPDLWRSANLGVPFVDVTNTMLDASLPLTPPEWKEWGNPLEDTEAFELIRSYSPYDNIERKEYPPMFVSGGLNDPRVTYWEPAKWTAKMRAFKTDDNLLVMRMNMGAGHFANSGRYGRLRDYAEEYAFMLLAHQISD